MPGSPFFVNLIDESFAHQAVDDRIVGESFDGQAFLPMNSNVVETASASTRGTRSTYLAASA